MKIEKVSVKEFLSEFLGTFILVMFNDGAVAQSVFSNGDKGGPFPAYWGAGVGACLGVLVSGGVSGGHINPAVTLAMAAWRKLPWVKVPYYLMGQYAGAFLASSVLYGVYFDALKHFETTRSLKTAGIWATYPGTITNVDGAVSDFLTNSNGFADQVVGTMLLLICVCAITDTRNVGVPQYLVPLYVGFAVLNINNCFGLNCSCAINPARDFAPRLFTFIAGWGTDPFAATTIDGIVWWWVPIIAPHVGGILGAGIYIFFIERHHPREKDKSQTRRCRRCKERKSQAT
ncbi:aquaporin-7-like [Palaemon carinicauda]|uniref:aquaporin-7-like n=1 Tax=Palaemon carinicauda TaxID=392227 RepID=UPI0035B60F16